MINSNAPHDMLVLALHKAIIANFDRDDWIELGAMTDTADLIRTHHRLLRSLAWGDEDYSTHVFEVLPQILSHAERNLEIIAELVKLDQFLRTNHAKLYRAVIDTSDSGRTIGELDQPESTFGTRELETQRSRILRNVDEDPAAAIGASKDLLEAAMKHIIGAEKLTGKETVHELLKKVRDKLGLGLPVDPEYASTTAVVKRTLSNLTQLVLGVFELRGELGTGHGRINPLMPDPKHARLAANSAYTVSHYLLELSEGFNE